jgi:hypothetical protein
MAERIDKYQRKPLLKKVLTAAEIKVISFMPWEQPILPKGQHLTERGGEGTNMQN